jgi:hypothetical protein
MEFPVAVFHFLFWVTHRVSGVPIHVFMPLFKMHDVHLSIIFPLLRSSSAKLIPMAVGLMAIFFNSLNSSRLDWFAESQRDLFRRDPHDMIADRSKYPGALGRKGRRNPSPASQPFDMFD